MKTRIKSKIDVSLILPCFNEEKRLFNLEKVINYLKNQSFTWEIIVVDDGSTDQTSRIAKKYLRNISHTKIISHDKNYGKGQAIKSGIMVACGKYVVFSDIDFSTPISDIKKIITQLKDYPVAIGVRRHIKSVIIKHQPWIRETLGKYHTKFVNLLLTPGILDVTCGFKGFQNHAAKNLFTRSHVSGWAFDAELLFLAQKSGYRIAQVPIAWKNDTASKVHLVSATFQVFKDIIKIRTWYILGKYNLPKN